ncbi:MAG TPA: hypothetical protein V6C58_00230 [Allocoleopsis sp.]
MLDTFSHLTAIAFREKVKYYQEIEPLSRLKFLKKYEYGKSKMFF